MADSSLSKGDNMGYTIERALDWLQSFEPPHNDRKLVMVVKSGEQLYPLTLANLSGGLCDCCDASWLNPETDEVVSIFNGITGEQILPVTDVETQYDFKEPKS